MPGTVLGGSGTQLPLCPPAIYGHAGTGKVELMRG